MYCHNCAAIIDDNVSRCPKCGAAVNRPRSFAAPVSPADAVINFFTHYMDFKGRSRRSEYWWAVLFVVLLLSLMNIFSPTLGTICSYAFYVPAIAAQVRRLHDTCRTGKWVFVYLVPVAGFFVMLAFLCQDSAPDNQWGVDPKR